MEKNFCTFLPNKLASNLNKGIISFAMNGLKIGLMWQLQQDRLLDLVGWAAMAAVAAVAAAAAAAGAAGCSQPSDQSFE